MQNAWSKFSFGFYTHPILDWHECEQKSLEISLDQLSAGAQQLPRTALATLQQHALASDDSQSDPQVHPQASATWGMTQEAQYFADLDTELLLEDEQDQPQTQPQDQDQPGHQQDAAGQDCLGHTTCNKNRILLQSLPMNHPALQTPDAVALAKYHPNLQVSVATTWALTWAANSMVLLQGCQSD